MPIRVLPDEVASAIAAGEVIERPASVVRELLENALDAGAGRVAIRVEGAGQRLIEVGDDGVGIAAEDLPLAVARYATSKLETRDDLFAIGTLGFRGEALASIAAVSRLQIVSRPGESPTGASIGVEGGVLGKVRSVGAPRGTVVTVRDLFFNTPARRKFLKTEGTERRRIVELAGRYALAYPSVAFVLESEERRALETTGRGDPRETLAAIFDVETARSLIELTPPIEGTIAVAGYVSPPSLHRSSRRDITFFVNGRWIQDAGLSAAVVQAYQGLLMVGRYPLGFLRIDLDPQEVDVNVHPAKAEVRFRSPDQIFGTVLRTVRATLLSQAPPPSIGFESTWSGAPSGTTSFAGWSPAESSLAATAVTEGAPSVRPPGEVPLLRAVGQVGTAYLVAEGPDGLYLIDQHAAHERILFERLEEARRNGRIETQALLDLEPIELGRSEMEMLPGVSNALAEIGLAVEPFGGSAVRLRTMPALLSDLNPAEAIHTALGDFEEDEAPLESAVASRLAARVCKRAAIRAGQILSLSEQAELLRQLEACASPRTCPHGRPTMIHISVDSLERQFGRRG
jgi:DNA mismatch repair protein MutL